MSGRQKVVIVGGGIAGLTAAHELIERDFDVEVFERRLRCGGKAASVRVDLEDPPLDDLPGEHGFRFFPGWYRHLPDTLGRIPSDRHRGHRGDRTVLDHLVNVNSNLLASYNRDPIPIVLHAPRSADQAQKLLSFVVDAQKMGLTVDDALLFFSKLVEFLSVPDEVRRQKYDAIAWTDFVDSGKRTPAFRVLASQTRTLVAAKASEASAYTIATMAVRTLFESSLTIDRVLDGPTSEVWIEPWRRYLEGQGVTFNLGYDLDAITFNGSRPDIASLIFSRVDDQYFKAASDDKSKGRENTFPEYADWRRVRDPKGRLDSWPNVGPLNASMKKTWSEFSATELAGIESFAGGERVWLAQGKEIEGRLVDRQLERKAKAATKDANDVDYYVFAIPIEQLAYYINRSTMMTYHNEKLRNIVRLSASVDWMTGIQFYLSSPLNLEAGHIVCADSEWALTAIDQTQFWRDANLPKEVQSILSVDISEWNKKGRFNNKEAYRCTKEEIATEVWQQLKLSLNRPAGKNPLQDSMKLGYHLDDNVIERYDRKKQAAYNRAQDDRAQAVRFSADERLSQGLVQGDPPFIFGERIEINVEPILVNRPGSLALRPAPSSDPIPNMFIAADYVDTATNLACMEGANEAARLAVNAILDRAGSKRDRCQTWDFADSEVLSTLATFAKMVERSPGVRKSIEAAASTATTLGAMATRAGQNIVQLWKKR